MCVFYYMYGLCINTNVLTVLITANGLYKRSALTEFNLNT